MRSIWVFCGSSPGNDSAYAAGAVRLGRTLAQDGITLVYGGGRGGLMGVIADAVLGVGNEAIGLITEALLEREIGHAGLSDLRVVGSMRERKALMSELSDGFIALPVAAVPRKSSSSCRPGRSLASTRNPTSCSMPEAIMTRCSPSSISWSRGPS